MTLMVIDVRNVLQRRLYALIAEKIQNYRLKLVEIVDLHLLFVRDQGIIEHFEKDRK